MQCLHYLKLPKKYRYIYGLKYIPYILIASRYEKSHCLSYNVYLKAVACFYIKLTIFVII